MHALCGAPFGAFRRRFGLMIRISGTLHPLCFVVNQASYVAGHVGLGDFDCGAGQANGPDFQTHAVFLIGEGMFDKGPDP